MEAHTIGYSSELQTHKMMIMMMIITMLLLLLLLLLSSSLSPLHRVFIHIFLRQTMSLGDTLLQLFCRCLWCLYL